MWIQLLGKCPINCSEKSKALLQREYVFKKLTREESLIKVHVEPLNNQESQVFKI